MDDDATEINTTTTTTTLFTTNEEEEEDCTNSWSDIHEDMIHLIFKRCTAAADCTAVADCIRFGSVCVSWRSVQFPCLHPDLLHPQLPLLMIPTPPPPPSPSPPHDHYLQQLTNTSTTTTTTLKPEEETRSFYRVSEKSVYKDLQISLPYNRYCRGSSHGWIITSGRQDTAYSVELFNPFISVNNDYQTIQLPPLTAFPEEILDIIDYLDKAMLSLNPSTHPKDYVVMAIYGSMRRLGFWRPGDLVWTDVDFDWGPVALDDVIYHKGLFYVVNVKGEVMIIDDLDAGAGAGVRRLAPPQRLRRKSFKKYLPLLSSFIKNYLVESEGDLFLVNKGGGFEVADIEFRVLKLINREETGGGGTSYASPEWKVMNTLPGRMLFVGNNASISLTASDIPGGKSSCIYFTDDEASNSEYGYPGTGIFSMEENKLIEKLRPMGEHISPVNTIWVEPTLRCCFNL